MAKTIGLGIQDFEEIHEKNIFYIDKTDFIKEWWESGDDVTLITRPRRFGKTLNMSMLEKFFSNRYAGRAELFEGLSIWEEEKYRELQGTYPVIFLTFAPIKEASYDMAYVRMTGILEELYQKRRFLLEGELLSEKEKDYFESVKRGMDAATASEALRYLSDYLSRYYGKKVIILLDEYDTPMQEAYVYGYWEKMVQFTRSLFNASFKTNPYLERAVMTGITRVSRESMFSDLNNLNVVTATSQQYATAFGFTGGEVFSALDEQGLPDSKEEVEFWYDGFVFGDVPDIYNPWSIINFLKNKRLEPYWANTSSNSLAGKLIREGSPEIKMTMERLMKGESFRAELDEQIVFDQLDQDENAVWSLLMASGYLKAVHYRFDPERRAGVYDLKLTNFEVLLIFEKLISGWFRRDAHNYNDFIKALLLEDVDAMNMYMNRVAMSTFSYFDTGRNSSGETEPERFYHGFVLGLLVDLREQYSVLSNRESGFGRYDVVLEPKKEKLNAVVIEFKVHNPRKEKDLEETAAGALRQIEEKEYDAELMGKGFRREQIRHYGFAFEGKKVLICRQ